MSAILNFQKFEFLRLIGFAPPVSVNMPNFINIGQLKLWRTYDVFFYFVFHYGGRLPSWTHCARWTTHQEHSRVFIVTQTLV